VVAVSLYRSALDLGFLLMLAVTAIVAGVVGFAIGQAVR
jgi:hypothetical protein